MSINDKIQARIKTFVSELEEMVRAEAVTAVASALGTGGAPKAAAKPAAKAAAAPKAAAAAAAPKVGRRKKGEKRTAAEIERAEAAVLDYVAKNQGQGVEQIGKALGMKTAELQRPIQKLLAEKKIRREGEKRGTRYFVGGGGAAAPAAAAPKKAGKKK